MKILKFLPVLGLILFVWIIWSNDPVRILDAFLGLDLAYFTVAVIAGLIILVLKAYKWKLIIGLHDLDYPLGKSVKVWSIGLFAGFVTPGRVGDLIRALYLKRDAGNFGKSISTVIIDRILDLVAVIIFSAIGILLFSQWFGTSFVSIGLFSGFIIFFIFVIYMITNKKMTSRLARPLFNFFVPDRHKGGLRSGFDDFHRSMGKMRKGKTSLILMLLLSMIIWLLSVLEIYILSISMGLGISYIFLVALLSITAIIELIPVSIMGLGTREAFFIFIFAMIGIGSQQAISFSLLYLIVGYWMIAMIGLLFWFRNPIKLKR